MPAESGVFVFEHLISHLPSYSLPEHAGVSYVKDGVTMFLRRTLINGLRISVDAGDQPPFVQCDELALSMHGAVVVSWFTGQKRRPIALLRPAHLESCDIVTILDKILSASVTEELSVLQLMDLESTAHYARRSHGR